MYFGTGQGTDDSGDGGKILVIAHDAVTEKYEIVIGQVGIGGRGRDRLLHQCGKMIQTIVVFRIPVLHGTAQY